MSDIGYSSQYEVYLTQNNGVQIVTNELSLQILKQMRFREISPSEIANAFGISKSTVQGNIGKLLRAGIVSQEDRVNDARSTVFRLNAVLIFCSDADVEWQQDARSASIDRIIANGLCTVREDLSLYGVSLTESGLNVVQGLFAVGEAITKDEGGPNWWKRTIDFMEVQCASHGIETTVEYENGLNLQFTSKGDNISDIPLVVVPMIGAIVGHARSSLGYNLAHEISLKITEAGRKVEMSVPAFAGQDYHYESSERIISSYKAEQSFAIYSIDGKATLFLNPTMISILDNLTNDDYSLNGLEEVMGIPKPTIYASLMKLSSIGAVALDPDSGVPKKYTLLADPILYTVETNEHGRRKLDDIVNKAKSGSMDYYTSVLAYSMETISCMGVHFDKMFIRAGRNAAIPVLEKMPNISPQEFVDLACTMVSLPDKAKVMSYLPVSVRVTLDKETLWDTWPGDFVMGFIAEGLRRLMGDGFKILVETYRAGESKPIASLKG